MTSSEPNNNNKQTFSHINFDLDERPTIDITESDIPEGRDIATVSDSVYVSLSRHGQILSAGRMLKSDRFPGCQRSLKDQPTIDGVPNWRKVDLPDHVVRDHAGGGVFGCAQPTRTGIRNAVDYLVTEGYEEVVWVNMREEYVVYIGENSYCVKERFNPFSNINLNGIKYQNLEESEETLCEELSKESFRFLKISTDDNDGCVQASRRVMLMDEAPIPNNAHFGMPYYWWCYDHLESLSTIRELYEEQKQHSTIPISYRRVPVTDEQAPSAKDIDHLIEFLRHSTLSCRGDLSSPEKTNKKKIAFVFNCQMGRGRTTTAMAVASMVLTADADAGTEIIEKGNGDISCSQEENCEEKDINNPKLPSHPSLFLSKMCNILDDIDDVNSEKVCNFVDGIINECHLMQNLRSEVSARYHAHAQHRQSLLNHLSSNEFLEEDKYGRNYDVGAEVKSKMVLKKVNKHTTASEVYCNYLERYLFLLLVGAYVQTGTTDRFTAWLDKMPNVSKQYWCLIETLNRNA